MCGFFPATLEFTSQNDEGMTIGDIVADAISSRACDLHVRAAVVNHIILCGGRLQDGDLRSQVAKNIRAKLPTARFSPDGLFNIKNLAWIGASICAKV